MKTVNLANSVGTFDDFKNDILNDYYICLRCKHSTNNKYNILYIYILVTNMCTYNYTICL